MNKKGMGLTDFFSIIAFAIILLIFYGLLWLQFGTKTFELKAQLSSMDDSISLMGILRTPVLADGKEMNIADLIALSDADSSKKNLLEKEMSSIIDSYFGLSVCTVFCVNEKHLSAKWCKVPQLYKCPISHTTIPGYNTKPIEVSFRSYTGSPESEDA